MNEKILNTKKNGLAMLLLFGLLYLAALGLLIFGAMQMEFEQYAVGIPCLVVGILWLSVGAIPFRGLKLLNPGEALVLTLFGEYVGTLKGDGYYWVNPFCSAVNPAAKTKLSQSGDIENANKGGMVLNTQTGTVNVGEAASKKIWSGQKWVHWQ